jgi:hypothetical protein
VVDRFRLADHDGFESAVPRLIYLESGAIEVTLLDAGLGEGRAPQLTSVARGALEAAEREIQMIAPGRPTALQPGDLLRLPPGTAPYRLRVPRGEVALGVIVELIPTAATRVESQRPARGASGEQSAPATLATDRLMEWQLRDRLDGLRRWTAAAITLGAGATVTVGEVPGVALLGVEAGALSIAVGSGNAMAPATPVVPVEVVSPAPGGEARPLPAPLAVGEQRVFGAGASALLPAGGTVTLRNAGEEPVSVLVIAVVAAD